MQQSSSRLYACSMPTCNQGDAALRLLPDKGTRIPQVRWNFPKVDDPTSSIEFPKIGRELGHSFRVYLKIYVVAGRQLAETSC